MRTLHLFAGAGGGLLADLLLNHVTVCAVEINKHCRQCLRVRQEQGILPSFRIYKDVKKFDGKKWQGKVDMVCAGFPCQPYSTAGKRDGEKDERNLWPETIRIIREVGCQWAFLENVPGLLAFDYFGQILGDLAEAGYDAEWLTLSAAAIGAPHRRRRLWILARISNGSSFRRKKVSEQLRQSSESGIYTGTVGWWQSKSRVDRVVNGMAEWMERIKALGNGQVPAVAAKAFQLLRFRYEE